MNIFASTSSPVRPHPSKFGIKIIFQDFPGPGNFTKKFQNFPGGVETLYVTGKHK